MCSGRYNFLLCTRDLKTLDQSAGSCGQYSPLLWKAANPVCLNRTNFHPEASNPASKCCQSQIHTVFYNLSMRWQTLLSLAFHGHVTCQRCWYVFMIRMVVAATFLMCCNKGGLYLSVCSSIALSLLKRLV